jgi:hypothetical protein
MIKMKKILKFSLIIFLIMSCSKDDSKTPLEDVLLTKVITHNLISTPYETSYETNFIYDGKKLIQMFSVRFKNDLTYDGNKIVKLERSYNQNGIYNPSFEVIFFYDNLDRLIRFKKYVIDSEKRLLYICDLTYNNQENTVNMIHDYVQDFPDYISTINSNFRMNNNNEIIEVIELSNNQQDITKLVYDNYNHPFRNVIGIDKISLFNEFYPTFHEDGISTNYGNLHNRLKVIYNTPNGIIESPIQSFEYNDEGFPSTIDKGNNYVSDELFYN